jgi:hypothetical protein
MKMLNSEGVGDDGDVVSAAVGAEDDVETCAGARVTAADAQKTQYYFST